MRLGKVSGVARIAYRFRSERIVNVNQDQQTETSRREEYSSLEPLNDDGDVDTAMSWARTSRFARHFSVGCQPSLA